MPLWACKAQIGADAAAVITTEGFTKGALDVAVDADIALVRLDAYTRSAMERTS